MSSLVRRAHELVVSEQGPTATEYAIMLALIIVVAMASIRAFGIGLYDTFQAVSQAMFG
jgi:pilus assembly protein Flp/PilA